MDFATQLDGMNLAQLRELQAQIEKQMIRTERQTMEHARDQIYGIAHNLGLSFRELAERTGLIKELNAPREGRAHKPHRVIAPRYAHPTDSSKRWTGQGKRPNWIKELLESGGYTLDQLRVSGV